MHGRLESIFCPTEHNRRSFRNDQLWSHHTI